MKELTKEVHDRCRRIRKKKDEVENININ